LKRVGLSNDSKVPTFPRFMLGHTSSHVWLGSFDKQLEERRAVFKQFGRAVAERKYRGLFLGLAMEFY